MTSAALASAAALGAAPRRTLAAPLAALALLGSLVPTSAGVDGLRGPRPLVAATWAHTKDVKLSLDEVLNDAVGHGMATRSATEVRVDRIQEALRPLYTALPRNSLGLLGHSTVRYALHRYFVHRHALFIKGLEPAGDVWNSSSPASILEDHVPAYVQHVFEERLHHGFDLRELAVLGAALEHIIHVDAVNKLKESYGWWGLDPQDDVSEEQLEHILDMYMYLVLKDDEVRAGQNSLEHHLAVAAKIWNWANWQKFVRELQESTLEAATTFEAQRGFVSFSMAVKVMEAIMDRIGRWQDGECRTMESNLASSEDPGTGRIKLGEFHKKGWQFQEPKEYLRRLGALDDSDPRNPRVIIPNYLDAATNCISSSSLYSMCCIDQCEELLGHLERRLAAPEAAPAEVAELLRALPSASVPAPRELPAPLLARLDEVAAKHGGRVPLHGRLFSQWMHHAYPRECPYPHLAGTTKPLTPSQWMWEMGTWSAHSDRDRDGASAPDDSVGLGAKDLVDGDLGHTSLPWLASEELVFDRTPPPLRHELWVLLRGVVLVAGLFSATLSASKVLGSAFGSLQGGKGAKLRE